MKGCIPTIQDVDFEKEFIREPAEYERVIQRIFAMDRIGYSHDEWKSLALLICCGEEGSGLWVAKVLFFV